MPVVLGKANSRAIADSWPDSYIFIRYGGRSRGQGKGVSSNVKKMRNEVSIMNCTRELLRVKNLRRKLTLGRSGNKTPWFVCNDAFRNVPLPCSRAITGGGMTITSHRVADRGPARKSFRRDPGCRYERFEGRRNRPFIFGVDACVCESAPAVEW